jgi:hypothetical protein
MKNKYLRNLKVKRSLRLSSKILSITGCIYLINCSESLSHEDMDQLMIDFSPYLKDLRKAMPIK